LTNEEVEEEEMKGKDNNSLMCHVNKQKKRNQLYRYGERTLYLN
jgi:hypothetical protein